MTAVTPRYLETIDVSGYDRLQWILAKVKHMQYHKITAFCLCLLQFAALSLLFTIVACYL